MEGTFEQAWAFGVSAPRRTSFLKLGRKAAQRHFAATVKTDEDFADMIEAIAAYQRHLARNPWLQAQHGSTWFNNWKDYVPEERTEAIEDDPMQYHWPDGGPWQAVEHQAGCGHVYQCTDDLCQSGRSVNHYCPKCVAGYMTPKCQ